MMRPSVLILTGAVACVIAGLAAAQTPETPAAAPATPATAAAEAPAAAPPPAAPGRAGRGAALLAGRGGRAGLLQQPTAERFDAADANKDGKLDPSEFGKTMDERVSNYPQIAGGLFRLRDRNMDGFVSKEEFTAAVGPIGGGLAGRGGRGGGLTPPPVTPAAPQADTPPAMPAAPAPAS